MRPSYREERSCLQKVRYKTQAKAEMAISFLGVHVYPCEFCKGWHLTTGNIPVNEGNK